MLTPFDTLFEQGIVFCLLLSLFSQAWIAIQYMIKATKDNNFMGIYDDPDTEDDAQYTTGIICCALVTMGVIGYSMYKGKKGGAKVFQPMSSMSSP